MKKSTIIIFVAIGLVGILLLWFFNSTEKDDGIKINSKSGKFTISVSTSGELESKNSTNIQGPSGLRGIGIYEDLKLNNIIDEGSLVDSGDYIATIDQSPILNKMKEVDANLEKLLPP